jgi:hypothetical protein
MCVYRRGFERFAWALCSPRLRLGMGIFHSNLVTAMDVVLQAFEIGVTSCSWIGFI